MFSSTYVEEKGALVSETTRTKVLVVSTYGILQVIPSETSAIEFQISSQAERHTSGCSRERSVRRS
jgi:hypothetical protein